MGDTVLHGGLQVGEDIPATPASTAPYTQRSGPFVGVCMVGKAGHRLPDRLTRLVVAMPS